MNTLIEESALLEGVYATVWPLLIGSCAGYGEGYYVFVGHLLDVIVGVWVFIVFNF